MIHRLPILPVVFLAACAGGPTALPSADYGPLGGDSPYGYSSEALSAKRVRVGYVGPGARAAKAGAWRRAAELAREAGATHVEVLDESSVEPDPRVVRRAPSVTVAPDANGDLDIGVSAGVGITGRSLRRGEVEHGLVVRFRRAGEPSKPGLRRVAVAEILAGRM